MWFWRTIDSIQYVKLIFKCSKSTSKKYDFKKSNTHFSSPWVLDYACKKVELSVEPDYQKYPSSKAMSGCLYDLSILKGVRFDLKSGFSQNRLLAILWIIWILFIFRINNLNHMILPGLEYRLVYQISRQLIWLEQ